MTIVQAVMQKGQSAPLPIAQLQRRRQATSGASSSSRWGRLSRSRSACWCYQMGFAGGGGGDDGGDRDAGEERERAREQLLGAAGLG